jgi:hypothetical protein
LQFQEMPKRGGRPAAIPGQSGIEVDADAIGLLPNLGDHVRLQPSGSGTAPVIGKVRTRLFTYPGPGVCRINIVIQHDDSDWSLLISE